MAMREPCPGRIIDDTGGAFAMGCVGGSIYYMIRGALNSPRGERFRGGFWAIKYRAPVMGGSFAQWGGIFSTLDCLITSARGDEGAFNAIAAGAGTGAILSSNGIKGLFRGAALGGGILSVIEGLSYFYTRYMTQQQQMMMQIMGQLNDERIKRQSAGLPDFTPEEMQAIVMNSIKSGKLDMNPPRETKKEDDEDDD